MGMIEEVKKYGWALAIGGTVLGIAVGDFAKSGVAAVISYASRVIDPPSPPQIVFRMEDFSPADSAASAMRVYALNGAMPRQVRNLTWGALSTLSIADLPNGFYLFQIETNAPRGRVMREEAVDFAGVTRLVVLPTREHASWRAVIQTAAAPPPSTVGAAPNSPSPLSTGAATAAELRALVRAPPDDPAWRWLGSAFIDLGVSEQGGDWDRARIANFFADTNVAREQWSADLPWSAAFLNSVFVRTGLRGTGVPTNASWLAWGTQLDQPRPGAVAVIRLPPIGNSNTPRHFAGLLIELRENCALLLGGNVANSVAVRCYRPQDIEAYRWPNL